MRIIARTLPLIVLVFDYIPLSFECTDLLLQSRKINSLGLLKVDYHCICFLSPLLE